MGHASGVCVCLFVAGTVVCGGVTMETLALLCSEVTEVQDWQQEGATTIPREEGNWTDGLTGDNGTFPVVSSHAAGAESNRWSD